MRQWLVEIREKQNITQDVVAKHVGVTRQMIGMIENNKANPHPKTAKAIAEALNFERYGIDWTKFYEDTQNGIGKGIVYDSYNEGKSES